MTTLHFHTYKRNIQQLNIIYSFDKKTLIHCPKNYSGEFEIPEGTETVGIEAFAGCKALTSVIFPKSLQKTQMLAFANCSALSTISITTHQTIAIAYDAFDSIHFENCVLEVPLGATSNYNNAETWCEFKCIIEKTRTAEVQYYKNNSLKQVI
jgi:predicted metal-binding protein